MTELHDIPDNQAGTGSSQDAPPDFVAYLEKALDGTEQPAPQGEPEGGVQANLQETPKAGDAVPAVPQDEPEGEVTADTLQAEEDQAPVPARRRAPSVSTVIAVIVLVAGLGIIAYPGVSDWWNTNRSTHTIANYAAAVQDAKPEMLAAMLASARAYNERLVQDGTRFSDSDAGHAEYESLLNLTGDGVMGYVQIDAINVSYPIYHGMDDTVLQIAIGHFEGSSLPVGGPSTHAVITGHRGLPSARLFSDLDRLVEGNTFTITVLNQTVTYQVDQIRVVKPDDLRDLDIEVGEDYCTLVTCTPYGVNTHRMLVRGHRVPNSVGDGLPADAIQIPRYIAIPAAAIPLLFMFLVTLLVYYRTRGPVMTREQVAVAIRDVLHEVEVQEPDGTEGRTNE